PQRGCARVCMYERSIGTTPLGLGALPPVTQGSRVAATLGWRAQSLRDWVSLSQISAHQTSSPTEPHRHGLVIGSWSLSGCWCLVLGASRGRFSPNFKSLWLVLEAWSFSGCWMLVLGAFSKLLRHYCSTAIR